MAPSINNTVCVMDAAGRLGSSLVDRLLRRGYTVHAAVQSQGDVAELMTRTTAMNFSGDGKLKAFVADPFDYHSIVEALKGCSGLFYTFEPTPEEANYDEYMAEVEVRAAHNVIEACSQVDTIDKVVFTSSLTSIIWRDDHATFDSEFDERHWSSVNLCRKYKLWHALSKTLSEKTAWALAMDREVNMVSINAGLLMSPDLTITNPYLKGAAEMYENGVFVTVDLDFLVNAHICVYEDVSSYGRYVCFNHIINREEDAVKLAQMLTPSAAASAPPRCDNDMKMIQQRISNKKMNKLIVDFDSDRTAEDEIH